MEPRGKNQTVSREDIDVMRNKLDQLIEDMIALTNRDDNMQQIVVTENVISPHVNDQAQP